MESRSKSDLLSRGEKLLTIAELARQLPGRRPGKRMNQCTIWRAIKRGVGGHYLEAVRLGGFWVTSREAYERFISSVAASAETSTEPPAGSGGSRPLGPTSERRRAAQQMLDDAGIGGAA